MESAGGVWWGGAALGTYCKNWKVFTTNNKLKMERKFV